MSIPQKDNLQNSDPSANLLPSIMKRIEREERKRYCIGIILWSCIAACSFFMMVWAISAMQYEIARSGIPQFFSFLFYSPNMVKIFWNDFALSILENLPTINIIALLIPALVLLWSLKFLAKDIVIVRTNLRHSH